ncbi:MAG TPA: hypothetical protein DCM71_27850 [Runella sp.]|nr:hypothetical protein [Runella sp.]
MGGVLHLLIIHVAQLLSQKNARFLRRTSHRYLKFRQKALSICLNKRLEGNNSHMAFAPLNEIIFIFLYFSNSQLFLTN